MIEPFTKRDFDAAYADFERFWPGRRGLRALLHPIYLYQFGETASAIRDGDELVAYLLGFLTPAAPPEGSIQMVAVGEDRGGRGLARHLYRHFEAEPRRRGAAALRAVTTPGNLGSIAFHQALDFEAVEGDMRVGPVPVLTDSAGPGQHRVVFVKRLEST